MEHYLSDLYSVMDLLYFSVKTQFHGEFLNSTMSVLLYKSELQIPFFSSGCDIWNFLSKFCCFF